MSFRILSGFLTCVKSQCFGQPTCIAGTFHQKRFGKPIPPVYRPPYWYVKKESELENVNLTTVNEKFLASVVRERYSKTGLISKSPLKEEPFTRGTWFPGCRRTGLIAINLGILPQWQKDGTHIFTTLLKIVENHVINFKPPGTTVDLRKYALKYKKYTKSMGNLIVGAVNSDPQMYTKAYCALFNTAGTMPKKILTKFPIHSEAIIQPGTPLYAAHFQVGDYVDITAKTTYRGFHGVMKRWGFKGMPASHGQTKTHRRPGCIGEGRRVWPGKKMPGHVGNKHRTMRGLQILRINHKHNVIYVKGGIPGEIGSFAYIHDTLIKGKVRETEPPFPTFYPDEREDPLPEEEFHESLFQFTEPTIMFEVEKTTTKSKRKTG